MSDSLIDVRTAILLGALLSLLQAVVLVSARHDLPRQLRPAASSWLWGTALQGCAYILFSLQGRAHPLIAIVLPNLLLLLGLTGYLRAIRLFQGRPDRWQLLLPTAVNVTGVTVLTLVVDHPAWRYVLISACVAWVLGLCASHLAKRRRIARSSSARILLAVFALTSGYFLLRAVFYAASTGPVPTFLTGSVELTMTALFAAIIPVVCTTGFLLLCADRVRGSLERIAAVDHLTGLLNRRSVESAGERAVHAARREEGQRLAVLIVDIDHFKQINDRHGHAVGDAALQLVSNQMHAMARTSDVVGRIGGEEFVVIAWIEHPQHLELLAERMRSQIESSGLRHEGETIRFTVSIGGAVLDAIDRDFDDLMRRADRALYSAKAAGRNRVRIRDASPPSEPSAPAPTGDR